MHQCVILESPYSGDIELNTWYAKQCMLDSLKRGEYPFVSHLLYTQVLDDTRAEQRLLGMSGHHAWQAKADAIVIYTDYGISSGMEEAIALAVQLGTNICYRSIL